MPNVNYGAGREHIGSMYRELRQALANKGAAENARRAENIEREGLFGTGISSKDVRGLANLALEGAEFGQLRMDKQMEAAEKSFGRRQAADERRLKTLQQRADLGDMEALKEIQGIQIGMSERRNAFEDKMSEYSGKGIWGTGFGSDEVGWRTSGESGYSKALRNTSQKVGGAEDDGSAQNRMALSADTEHMRQAKTPMGQRSPHDPDAVPDWRQAKTPMGQRSFHDPDAVSDWRQGQARPIRQAGSMGPRPGISGSNKFSEGIMNTKRRSGPVGDNAPFETFKDAFRNARREKGAGSTFDWRGNEYTTDYK